MNSFYDEIFSKTTMTPIVTLGSVLKIPLVLLVLGNIFYAFMLVLKLRILVDTLNSRRATVIKRLVYINLGISILGGLLGIVLILLG